MQTVRTASGATAVQIVFSSQHGSGAIEHIGRRQHSDEPIPDGRVFTQSWPAGTTASRRDHVIYYQHKADRAR